ncbi:hypothetical protein LSHI6S_01148 [Leifsonia shinshuensis]
MKLASAGSSCLVSAWWPTFTPAVTQSTAMNRANTCAVVMKSSVEAPPGCITTSFSASAELRDSSTKLECVSTQPFGRPVEPEV